MKRPNLTVLTHAHVQKLILETSEHGKKATGVQATIGGEPPQIFSAKREVILSAGSIGSPQILQISGIGPGDLLNKLDIEVVHDVPGVGENLHDHLQVRSVYKVSNTVTLNQRVNSLIGKAAMGLEYMLFRSGPLTMPPSQLGAFDRSDPDQPTANIEWHVQPLSLDKFGEPLHTFNAITPSVCNLRPTSRGHIRIKSPNPAEYPAITLNYLATDEDKQVAIEGLKFTRRIMNSPALSNFKPEEWLPGPSAQTDAELLEAAGNLGTTIFHPVSTCRMGSDPMAVVDDRLRVHGIAGLRVIDASIMPQITSGNTNAPTVMIAEKGAEMILADNSDQGLST